MHTIVNDWKSAELDTVDRVLCEFAVKLTFANHEIAENDIQKLRDSGLDDKTIHDAVQVISYFNYITRVADALGVQPNYDKTWG